MSDTLFMIDVVHMNNNCSYVAVPGQAYQFSRVSDSKVLPGAGMWLYSAVVKSANHNIETYKTDRPSGKEWFNAARMKAAHANILLYHPDNGIRCCYGYCMRHAIKELEEIPFSMASVIERKMLVRDFHTLYRHTQQSIAPLDLVYRQADIKYPKLMCRKPRGYNGSNPVVSMYVMGEGVCDMVVSDMPVMIYGLTHQELQLLVSSKLSLPEIWDAIRHAEDMEFRFDDPEESVFIGWLPEPGIDVSTLCNPVTRQDYEAGVLNGQYAMRNPIVEITTGQQSNGFSKLLLDRDIAEDILYFGTWKSQSNTAVRSIL